MFQPRQRFFDVQQSNNGWGNPVAVQQVTQPTRPDFADNVELKKQFGEQLSHHSNPFQAAQVIFPTNTGHALWVSNNWLNDPIVIEAKQKAEANPKLLDKTQLSARLLKFESEKHPNRSDVYLHDSKDRLAALKLYAEIQGWVGKAADISVNNSFTHNEMKIRLVSADKKEPKIVEHSEVNSDDNSSIKPLPIKIKLVGSKL